MTILSELSQEHPAAVKRVFTGRLNEIHQEILDNFAAAVNRGRTQNDFSIVDASSDEYRRKMVELNTEKAINDEI